MLLCDLEGLSVRRLCQKELHKLVSLDGFTGLTRIIFDNSPKLTGDTLVEPSLKYSGESLENSVDCNSTSVGWYH